MCEQRWRGRSCATELCPRGCSAPYGACVAGQCVCEPGWTGAGCENCSYPSPRDLVCAGHGACAAVHCAWAEGWTAPDCSLRKDYTLLAEEGWAFVDLHEPPHLLPSLINVSDGATLDDDENGAWIEIVEMLVPNMDGLTRLLETTQPLWVSACVPIERLPSAQRERIFFQFHTDRCLICGARGDDGELAESWLGPPRASAASPTSTCDGTGSSWTSDGSACDTADVHHSEGRLYIYIVTVKRYVRMCKYSKAADHSSPSSTAERAGPGRCLSASQPQPAHMTISSIAFGVCGSKYPSQASHCVQPPRGVPA